MIYFKVDSGAEQYVYLSDVLANSNVHSNGMTGDKAGNVTLKAILAYKGINEGTNVTIARVKIRTFEAETISLKALNVDLTPEA